MNQIYNRYNRTCVQVTVARLTCGNAAKLGSKTVSKTQCVILNGEPDEVMTVLR